jgi:hypothetical protein
MSCFAVCKFSPSLLTTILGFFCFFDIFIKQFIVKHIAYNKSAFIFKKYNT